MVEQYRDFQPPEQGEVQERSLKNTLKTSLFLEKPNPDIQNNSEYQAVLPLLQALHEQVWVWHGTGRYQYAPPNFDSQRDVLQGIRENGGLIPHFDPLDPVKGEMYSISTTPSPTYAVLYAERHFPKGKRLRNYAVQESERSITEIFAKLNDNRRSSFLWAYYLGAMVVEAGKQRSEAKMVRKFMQENKRQSNSSQYDYYHQKYTKQRVSKTDMIRGGGSDIEGNYPILIGIKHNSFEPTETTSLIQRHELRSRKPIYLDNFTHIEVPERYVNEVREALEGNEISDLVVIPLEWGEEYRKNLPISSILNGERPLR